MKSVKRNTKDNLHIEIQEYLSKHSGYKYKVVQNYLRGIYSGVCCYCESIFEHSASMNIEHFYPKDFHNKDDDEPIYEKYTRILCNLHYSCPKCNSLKNAVCPDGTESNNENLKFGVKIYSPNFVLKHIPITDRENNENDFELNGIKVEDKFKFETCKIIPVDERDDRAKGTIELFDLNGKKGRMHLLHERQRIYASSVKKLNKISKLLSLLKSGKCDKQIYEILDDYFHEMRLIFNNNFSYASMNRKLFLGIFVSLKLEYEELKNQLHA